jgi:hypothetical protein
MTTWLAAFLKTKVVLTNISFCFSNSKAYFLESPDMSEIEGEIVEAMGTSYVHGR